MNENKRFIVAAAEMLMLAYSVTAGTLFFCYGPEKPLPDWLRILACALLAFSALAAFLIPCYMIEVSRKPDDEEENIEETSSESVEPTRTEKKQAYAGSTAHITRQPSNEDTK